MSRLFLILLFTIASVVWAQEDAPDDEGAAEPVVESTEEISDEEIDDFELDRNQDHTEEDEDVFRPTDVVSFQQSVPFPVDI